MAKWVSRAAAAQSVQSIGKTACRASSTLHRHAAQIRIDTTVR
jgi:hypothetical protein